MAKGIENVAAHLKESSKRAAVESALRVDPGQPLPPAHHQTDRPDFVNRGMTQRELDQLIG